MKHKSLYKGALGLLLAMISTACNDSEGDLLQPKVYFESNEIKVDAEEEEYTCDISARISKPLDSPVSVRYTIGGQELVDSYNRRNGKQAKLLPAENYEFATSQSTVTPGEVYTASCPLRVKGMSTLEDGATFVLPVMMSAEGVTPISEKSLSYIVVKKPARIYKAMEFGTYWLDLQLPASFKYTRSVTYEALVYATRWVNLGTIMGAEGQLILRTGDAGIPTNQLNLGGWFGLYMPNTDVWSTGKWYHVALTYDGPTGFIAFYINGECIVSKTVEANVKIDLNNRFSIGYAYDYDPRRKWVGYMSEVRLWNVCRSANEIKENMLIVNPKSEGLQGYWKLDGSDIEYRDGKWYIIDQTDHHFDAVSNYGLRGDNGPNGVKYGEPPIVDTDIRL